MIPTDSTISLKYKINIQLVYRGQNEDEPDTDKLDWDIYAKGFLELVGM